MNHAMPTEKKQACSTARAIRLNLFQEGINIIPPNIDPAYSADLIDSRYAAAILRAQADALEKLRTSLMQIGALETLRIGSNISAACGVALCEWYMHRLHTASAELGAE